MLVTRTKVLKSLAIVFTLLCVLVFLVALVYRQELQNYRQTVFVEAALHGNVGRMKLLHAVGADVDGAACKAANCPPPIVAAAFDENSDAVRFLIDRGANVNGKMNRGQTALMVAAYHGHTDTVRLLLLRGADVNADSEGDTALQWANQKGHSEIVALLAKAGAAK